MVIFKLLVRFVWVVVALVLVHVGGVEGAVASPVLYVCFVHMVILLELAAGFCYAQRSKKRCPPIFHRVVKIGAKWTS